MDVTPAKGASAGRLQDTPASQTVVLAMVVALFFLFGGITNLNDVLIPKLKALFDLSYAEAMLVQFAFFTSYAIFSIPAAQLMVRIGYVRALIVGFAIMASGCLLFVPAARSALFPAFLCALFVLGGGITLLQVAVNPLIARLGPSQSAHSRLTFAQFFNALGVFLMVRFGAEIILGERAMVDPATLPPGALARWRAEEAQVISDSYVALTVLLALIALVFWRKRAMLDAQRVEAVDAVGLFGLLRTPRVAFGVAAIFAYVGAEVAIASLMIAYLGIEMGLAARAAGVLLSYYWLGALVGRLLGGFLLRRIVPGLLLALCAMAAITLTGLSIVTGGSVAGWALIAVGLANAVMFPTIFSLAIDDLDRRPGVVLLVWGDLGG